ncbi:MAG: hypothetical protein FWC71_04920 [Defluviitaleaceae bacterium]|nr:hypothetical protein [Defluviitaleaceae bacterium]
MKEIVNEQELIYGAQNGNALSMLQLGNHLMTQGKENDAVAWWIKAAEAGRGGAAYNLARHYSGLDSGYGNGPEMLKWLQKLAMDFNDGWGMLHLGVIMCGGTHQVWKRTISPDDFGIARNVEEGLRLIINGVKQTEVTSNDLTLYDYDAAAEVVRAYSGPLGIEVLKLALAYKTKARGLIPPGYNAMAEAAAAAISQMEEEISTTPPKRVVNAQSRTIDPSQPHMRILPANTPMSNYRGRRPAPRHIPPTNDITRRDPRSGFGLILQLLFCIAFVAVMSGLMWTDFITFDQETLADTIRMRVILYGILGVGGILLSMFSLAFRWGAMGSGKGIAILVAMGGLYSAMINTISEQLTVALTREMWEILLSAVGTAVMTSFALGLIMFVTVRIYDHERLTQFGKAALFLLIGGILGTAMYFFLTRVENLLLEIIFTPFRSVPFVWIASLPGMLLLRWAEEA